MAVYDQQGRESVQQRNNDAMRNPKWTSKRTTIIKSMISQPMQNPPPTTHDPGFSRPCLPLPRPSLPPPQPGDTTFAYHPPDFDRFTRSPSPMWPSKTLSLVSLRAQSPLRDNASPVNHVRGRRTLDSSQAGSSLHKAQKSLSEWIKQRVALGYMKRQSGALVEDEINGQTLSPHRDSRSKRLAETRKKMLSLAIPTVSGQSELGRVENSVGRRFGPLSPALSPHGWFRRFKQTTLLAPAAESQTHNARFTMAHVPDRPAGGVATGHDAPNEQECWKLFTTLRRGHQDDIESQSQSDEDGQSTTTRMDSNVTAMPSPVSPSRRHVNMDTLAKLAGLDLDSPGFRLFMDNGPFDGPASIKTALKCDGKAPCGRCRSTDGKKSFFDLDSDDGVSEIGQDSDDEGDNDAAQPQPDCKSYESLHMPSGSKKQTLIQQQPPVAPISLRQSRKTPLMALSSLPSVYSPTPTQSDRRGAGPGGLGSARTVESSAASRKRVSWRSPVADRFEAKRARLSARGWWDDVFDAEEMEERSGFI